jgi:hypothetical protein
MAFKKGTPKPANSGKKKGTVNKATADIKEAYKNLIEMNLENMTAWLEQIAAKDPAKAIMIISELSEYVIPKLARTEMTGKDGKDFIPSETTIIFK